MIRQKIEKFLSDHHQDYFSAWEIARHINEKGGTVASILCITRRWNKMNWCKRTYAFQSGKVRTAFVYRHKHL